MKYFQYLIVQLLGLLVILFFIVCLRKITLKVFGCRIGFLEGLTEDIGSQRSYHGDLEALMKSGTSCAMSVGVGPGF